MAMKPLPKHKKSWRNIFKSMIHWKSSCLFDNKNDFTCKDEQTIAYAELQKALFFCKRKRIPLLFVSVKEMVNDIRFLNMLEESYVDFRCIDFPWFCKENLRLIKAVVLYKNCKQNKCKVAPSRWVFSSVYPIRKPILQWTLIWNPCQRWCYSLSKIDLDILSKDGNVLLFR